MFQKARETAYLESTSFLLLLIHWRKPLIIIFLISLTASIIFSSSFFITPKFKSSVIFFPSATNSVSKILLDESNSEKQDILAFGEEEQAEQTLQILNSDEIREMIIKKYNLLSHYHIHQNEDFPITALNEQFKDNISFSKTEFMSVRIDVLDADPQMAANIANDIASLLDSMKAKIQHSRAAEALLIVKSAFESKELSMKIKEDSLRRLREMGVLDYRTQTEILNQELALANRVSTNENAALSFIENLKSDNDTAIINTKARIAGANARIKIFQSQLKTLANFGGISMSLNEDLAIEREELSKIKKQYDKLSVDASQNLTPKFIVNNATKAEKKSYPIRWIIVTVTVTITLILSIILLLLFEKVREIKYNL